MCLSENTRLCSIADTRTIGINSRLMKNFLVSREDDDFSFELQDVVENLTDMFVLCGVSS